MNADLKNDRHSGGVLLINKPAGITSFDVVARVRRLYGTRRVGHTGTLDPMATGLLAVLTGDAVKIADMITAERKEYVAEMKLGMTTDTADITGSVLSTCKDIPLRDEVIFCAESFIGRYMQTPPMYSAIKRGGKKLCDLAREGKSVEIEPREVNIFSLSADGGGDTYRLTVACSKGTYIRTLCEDIGKKLGCGAVMSALCRTGVGEFSLDGAYSLEDLEKMTEDERASALIPPERLFAEYPRIDLPDFYFRLCINGCEIYQKKIKTSYPTGTWLRVYGGGEFIGVGEIREYPDGSAVKIIARLFHDE